MLPQEELPRLTDEQMERVRKLHITEKGFAVVLKAGELARAQSFVKMETVARRIHEVLRKHDPRAELNTLLWDFEAQMFDYVVRRPIGSEHDPEATYRIPPELVDELVMGQYGAEEKIASVVVKNLKPLAE